MRSCHDTASALSGYATGAVRTATVAESTSAFSVNVLRTFAWRSRRCTLRGHGQQPRIADHEDIVQFDGPIELSTASLTLIFHQILTAACHTLRYEQD